MAHKRRDHALKALLWLRGGTSSTDTVVQELDDIASFIVKVNACVTCQRLENTAAGDCSHNCGYLDRVKDLFRTKSLRPLGLLLFCMCIIHSSGNAAIRPFLVQIFETFRVPMDPNWGSVSYKFQ